MILLLYLIITLIISALVIYKFNKGKYIVYLLVSVITALFGFYIEERSILIGEWSWETSSLLLSHVPLEMVGIYALLGFIAAVLTIYLKDSFKVNPSESAKKYALPILIIGALASVTILLYGFGLYLIIFFLFAGCYFFLRYQNPVIILTGIVSTAIEIIFDTLLLLFNGYLQYTIDIPFMGFFIVGIFISGLAIFLDEKIYSKKSEPGGI